MTSKAHPPRETYLIPGENIILSKVLGIRDEIRVCGRDWEVFHVEISLIPGLSCTLTFSNLIGVIRTYLWGMA